MFSLFFRCCCVFAASVLNLCRVFAVFLPCLCCFFAVSCPVLWPWSPSLCHDLPCRVCVAMSLLCFLPCLCCVLLSSCSVVAVVLLVYAWSLPCLCRISALSVLCFGKTFAVALPCVAVSLRSLRLLSCRLLAVPIAMVTLRIGNVNLQYMCLIFHEPHAQQRKTRHGQ